MSLNIPAVQFLTTTYVARFALALCAAAALLRDDLHDSIGVDVAQSHMDTAVKAWS